LWDSYVELKVSGRKVNNYVSPQGWYRLEYPDSWEVEEDDVYTTFTKSDDGVGALQFSAYQADVPQ